MLTQEKRLLDKASTTVFNNLFRFTQFESGFTNITTPNHWRSDPTAKQRLTTEVTEKIIFKIDLFSFSVISVVNFILIGTTNTKSLGSVARRQKNLAP
ncbi:MAG: hypothetical protein ACI8R9_002788 [Paraglaciecola sp.]